MHHVVALALESVVAFDLSIPAQVFGHRREPHYRFTACSPTGGPVASTTGFSIAVSDGIGALEHADTIVVPGYYPVVAPPELVLEALDRAHRRGARIVSVCTGAFALAHAGLLDERSATTHWQETGLLGREFPRVQVDPGVLFVDHGDIATSAGVAAGIDLCLHLVRQDHGAQLAASIARRLVVAPVRAGGQAQYIHTPQITHTSSLAPVLHWALTQLERPVTVGELAQQAQMSPRTFARRFREATGTTPHRWLVHQRVLRARQLLETTDWPMDRIATATGLTEASTLRRQFHHHLGVTPTAYRTTWQHNPTPQ